MTDINENIRHYKFSECAKDKAPILKGTIEDFLKKIMYNPISFGFNNLKETGFYLLEGWKFDFKPYLKKYVYKTIWGINEGYFINKTNCRKVAGTEVIYIKEI